MTVRSRRLIGALTTVIASAVLGSGLVATPSAAVPAPSDAVQNASTLAIPTRYLGQRLNWQPCDFDEQVREIDPAAPRTDCTLVTVPMDWRNPGANPDIAIAIAFSRATGVSQGLLTSNPGGPGASGLTLSAALALSQPRLFSDYDLLGFDPRGFGDRDDDGQAVMGQTLLRCLVSEAEIGALPTTYDYRVRSRQTHRVEVAEAKLLGKSCASSRLSRFVNTQQTAYDMEFLRVLLGQDRPGGYPKLNYIGYSYGTWLGTWYADSFPTRVGRFVLDANMNWTASMYDNQKLDSFSFQRRRDQMFYPWLARHHADFGYGTTTKAVAARYERNRATIAALYRRGAITVSPQDLDFAVVGSLYSNADFPALAELLVEVDDALRARSRADLRRGLDRLPLDRGAGSAPRPNGQDAIARGAAATVEIDGIAGQAVRCNDTGYPRDIQALLRRADADAKKYPLYGYANTVGMCSFWRHRPDTRAIDLAGAPRMLMIQSEGDPATAYEGAKAAHTKTASRTRLVSIDNEGQHGTYIGGPSRCADSAGDAFVFGGRLPGRNAICGTSPLPLDERVYKLTGPVDGKSQPLDGRQRVLAAPSANPLLEKIRRQVAAVEATGR